MLLTPSAFISNTTAAYIAVSFFSPPQTVSLEMQAKMQGQQLNNR